MKTTLWATVAVVLAFLIGWPLGGQDSTRPPVAKKDASVSVSSSGGSPTALGSAQVGSSVIELTGKTQCMPSRKGIIAPVPLHPVVEVLVGPGDRVKKGQVLVKLDDDEPQADVRAKKAALQNVKESILRAPPRWTHPLCNRVEAGHAG